MKRPEQIERQMLAIQQMRTLKQNGNWPTGAEYEHTARAPGALNQPAAGESILRPSAEAPDIVEAELVDEPATEADRAAMMRQQTNDLARRARAKLVQKPQSQWTERDFELESALDDYRDNAPANSGEFAAAYQNLYDLHHHG
jgi:hypothetical protein